MTTYSKVNFFNSQEESQQIIDLFKQTFTDSEGNDAGIMLEQLVTNLIATTKLDELLGFVTRNNNEQIIGCVLFSRLTLESKDVAFMLSPMAIITAEQGKGLGKKLIQFGVDHLKSINVDFLITYGDPAFYAKFGFEIISENIIKAPYELSFSNGWQALSLKHQPIKQQVNPVQCVDAFNDAKYWS